MVRFPQTDPPRTARVKPSRHSGVPGRLESQRSRRSDIHQWRCAGVRSSANEVTRRTLGEPQAPMGRPSARPQCAERQSSPGAASRVAVDTRPVAREPNGSRCASSEWTIKDAISMARRVPQSKQPPHPVVAFSTENERAAHATPFQAAVEQHLLDAGLRPLDARCAWFVPAIALRTYGAVDIDGRFGHAPTHNARSLSAPVIALTARHPISASMKSAEFRPAVRSMTAIRRPRDPDSAIWRVRPRPRTRWPGDGDSHGPTKCRSETPRWTRSPRSMSAIS